MIFARRRALGLVGAIGIAAAALSMGGCQRKEATTETPPDAQKPALLLLTTLPIVFGEEFSLEQSGSPALTALERRYRVVPISVTDETELAKGKLLLMAQPAAQSPENLVTLDEWVRRGGRVMLLADPMLEWPSKRPLGDRLRPPIMFTDTGLLGHWGLRLDAPEERRPVVVGGAHDPVIFVSPGRLVANTAAKCVFSRLEIVAECKIGRGRATIVADADFINPEMATLQNPANNNLAEMLTLLESMLTDSK